MPDTRPPKPGDPDVPLSDAFVVKVAVYAGGLSAGLGIRALDPGVLRKAIEASRNAVHGMVVEAARLAMRDADLSGISDEEMAETVSEFLAGVESGTKGMVARKVADGAEPDPGEDGRLEYVLNPDRLPMHRVEDVEQTSSKKWFRMVQKDEVLVEAIPPRPGEAGHDVRGAEVAPQRKLLAPAPSSVMGAGTTVSGNRLISAIDGMLEENAHGQLRVVPEVEVDVVGAQTGSMPDAGATGSNILVKDEIQSGYRVASTETVFVGLGGDGTTGETAQVEARHLVVNGRIRGGKVEEGRAEVGALKIQEVFAARQVFQRSIEAERVVVLEDSRFARLDADESILISGRLIGGCVVCRRNLTVAGDAGTKDGGSACRVVLATGGTSRKQQRMALIVAKQRKKAVELLEKISRLEDLSVKRATADPFWARLLNDGPRPAESPKEAATLRQYQDMVNETARLSRSLEAAKRFVSKAAEEESEDAEASSEAVILRFGGTLYLDVTIGSEGPAPEDFLEHQATYVVEGKRYRNHMLSDLLALLGQQANEHLQSEDARISERKQAIEQMFEGKENRPTAPAVAHKRFEAPIEWSGDDVAEDPAELHVETVGIVDSREPKRLTVRTEARVREPQQDVSLSVTREGARCAFVLSAGAGVSEQQDEAMEVLSALSVRGLSAPEFLEGKYPGVEAQAEQAGEGAQAAEAQVEEETEAEKDEDDSAV